MLETMGADTFLNVSFKHFLFFAEEFSLIEDAELKPLAMLIKRFHKKEAEDEVRRKLAQEAERKKDERETRRQMMEEQYWERQKRQDGDSDPPATPVDFNVTGGTAHRMESAEGGAGGALERKSSRRRPPPAPPISINNGAGQMASDAPNSARTPTTAQQRSSKKRLSPVVEDKSILDAVMDVLSDSPSPVLPERSVDKSVRNADKKGQSESPTVEGRSLHSMPTVQRHSSGSYRRSHIPPKMNGAAGLSRNNSITSSESRPSPPAWRNSKTPSSLEGFVRDSSYLGSSFTVSSMEEVMRDFNEQEMSEFR
jgi:hypothetical protein